MSRSLECDYGVSIRWCLPEGAALGDSTVHGRGKNRSSCRTGLICCNVGTKEGGGNGNSSSKDGSLLKEKVQGQCGTPYLVESEAHSFFSGDEQLLLWKRAPTRETPGEILMSAPATTAYPLSSIDIVDARNLSVVAHSRYSSGKVSSCTVSCRDEVPFNVCVTITTMKSLIHHAIFAGDTNCLQGIICFCAFNIR